MKAVIYLDVPDWQIGQDVSVYFPDTMMKHGKCELLKEQDEVALKPHYIDEYGKNFICGVECGNCGVEISATYKFCPHCGRKVKRE